MFSLTALFLTAFVCLAIGGAVGALLMRSLHPQEQANRELEGRLQDAETRLESYQEEVTTHFAETSTLVNKLTQDYKEVHEYLANSALKLANPEISRQLLNAAPKAAEAEEPAALEETDLAQPRDWAPKNPGDAGVLSENFGLEEEREAVEVTSVPRA